MNTKYLVGLMALLILPTALHAEEVETTQIEIEPIAYEVIQPGDLMRSESSTAVYYLGEDEMRYVFPDDATYFSWYTDFDDVQWVSNETLNLYPLGGIVMHQPGSSLLSIASNNTYYAIEHGGILRPLASADIAAELYGMEYKEFVTELPETFFGHYTLGSVVEFAGQYNKTAAMNESATISHDLGLQAPLQLSIEEEGFSQPTVEIEPNTAIKWTNNLDEAASVTEWDRIWGSGTLQPGESYIRYFIELGTWHYYSQYQDRNNFEGAIIVE